MNGNSLLLDTNIILYFLGGDKTLIPILEEKQLFISFISQLELLSYPGLSEEDKSIIDEFLSQCTIIDISSKIKTITIELRQKYKLKLPDCLILATSIYLNIPLISADSDFKKVNQADLIFYQK